ncbi:MAG: DMT family transporter [Nocardioidaceae bacterium]
MLSAALLAAAIVSEVTATISLKQSDGLTRLVPSLIVLAGYLISFYLMAMILVRGMNLGVVYAVWSAAGVSLIAAIDYLWFDQRLSTVQVAGLFLVVLGVAALELGGPTS